MCSLDLPNGWSWSIGESSRPLSAGGYYLRPAFRRVWANQYVDRFYELVVDTAGLPPKEHVAILSLYEERDGDIIELERIATRVMPVLDPSDEESQEDAERRIMAEAEALMERYPEREAD